MDFRLGLVVILTIVLTSLAGRWWWSDGMDEKGSTLSDLAWVPLLVGVVAARVATVLVDHPAGIVSLKEVMIIRGGTDFWIGVAVGVAAIALTVKDRYGVVPRLALLAPFGLIAYGVYHAGCVIQDGCPGPASSIGLAQSGIDQTVFPVGLIGGLVAVLAGLWFMRRPPSDSPMIVVAVLLAVLALIRMTVSVLTPSLVAFPGRDQILSVVALVTAAGLAAVDITERRRWAQRRRRSPDGDTAPI